VNGESQQYRRVEMFNVFAVIVISWFAVLLLLVSGGYSLIADAFMAGYLVAVIVVPIVVVWALRKMARSPAVIRKYGEGSEEWVKCPDCTGGAQLLGRKIPRHMWMDGGRDTFGPFWRTRQANVHACATCRGRGWLIGIKQADQLKDLGA
jgi:hypothetical protein